MYVFMETGQQFYRVLSVSGNSSTVLGFTGTYRKIMRNRFTPNWNLWSPLIIQGS